VSIFVNLGETLHLYDRFGKKEGGTKREGKKGRGMKIMKIEIEKEIETKKNRK
jgi:hypothetical protein